LLSYVHNMFLFAAKSQAANAHKKTPGRFHPGVLP
jgi:hypothetical protein